MCLLDFMDFVRDLRRDVKLLLMIVWIKVVLFNVFWLIKFFWFMDGINKEGFGNLYLMNIEIIVYRM